MQIDVILHTGENYDFTGKTVIVIDVLRASSTILTALVNGCREIIPVVEPEEALTLVGNLRGSEGTPWLLGGERRGLKLPDFDLGNSPLEYTKEIVGGKTLVFCTTNGTKALREAKEAEEILIGSFLNIGKVTSYLKTAGEEIALFCAGREGRPALEDLFCAGRITEDLLFASKNGLLPELSDTARIGMIAYRHLTTKGTVAAIAQTEHGQYLAAQGFTDDLRYCGQVDSLPQLAVYQDGRVKLKELP